MERRSGFKIVLLGDASVGKTSIVSRFVTNRFNSASEATVGAAFSTQVIALDTSPPRTVKFEIWDTAGQERFRSLAPMYYRGAAGAIVVCDVTDPDTFTRAQEWVNELHASSSKNCVIALACNKCDMSSKLNANHTKQYTAENGLLYFETSAKTGEGVQKMFDQFAYHLDALPKDPLPTTLMEPDEDGVISLSNSKPSEKRGCC